MSPLTPKQKKIFDFIMEHSEREGYAPSQQEIADAFGYRSLGTVQNYLVRLEREGLLERDWNARRGIRVKLPEGHGYEIPLSGTVAAGRPIDAVETPDTIDIPRSMLGRASFALRVKGDSMIEDGILDGDFVIVRKQPTAQSGQTVVALLGNEATVKRLMLRNGHVELHPANAALAPIIVRDSDEFRIEGVVVGVIRHC